MRWWMLRIKYCKKGITMLSDDIIITGNRAIARSYAKINLTLDVLGRRNDGYHEIESIMQTLSLFDLVIVDKMPYGISLCTNIKYLPNNEKNLAYQAAQLFFDECKINGGVKIMIHKNIPISAGLAGGSGNCAAVLCALNLLFNTHMSLQELCKLGKKLGADVPYCIMGQTCIARGIGEKLTQICSPPKMNVVIVKPPVSVSTALIYDRLDNEEITNHPGTDNMLKALTHGNIYEISDNLYNVMEEVTQKLHPVVGGVKKEMLEYGAINSCMSGSGPTVFGIFDSQASAKKAADSFSKRYKDVFMVKTLN